MPPRGRLERAVEALEAFLSPRVDPLNTEAERAAVCIQVQALDSRAADRVTAAEVEAPPVERATLVPHPAARVELAV